MIKLLALAQDKNGISGFYGRLGDLGTIDPQYDVAVSTACPALNNLVIENEREAQKAIALMRKKEVTLRCLCC